MNAVATRRVSGLLRVVAVLLAINGALTIVYAPLAPLPFVHRIIPEVNLALGIAWIVAAVAVWRLHPLGRGLGVVLCLWSIGVTFVTAVPALSREAAGFEVIALALAWTLAWSAVLDAVPLWVLLRRWPTSA